VNVGFWKYVIAVFLYIAVFAFCGCPTRNEEFQKHSERKPHPSEVIVVIPTSFWKQKVDVYETLARLLLIPDCKPCVTLSLFALVEALREAKQALHAAIEFYHIVDIPATLVDYLSSLCRDRTQSGKAFKADGDVGVFTFNPDKIASIYSFGAIPANDRERWHQVVLGLRSPKVILLNVGMLKDILLFGKDGARRVEAARVLGRLHLLPEAQLQKLADKLFSSPRETDIIIALLLVWEARLSGWLEAHILALRNESETARYALDSSAPFPFDGMRVCDVAAWCLRRSDKESRRQAQRAITKMLASNRQLSRKQRKFLESLAASLSGPPNVSARYRALVAALKNPPPFFDISASINSDTLLLTFRNLTQRRGVLPKKPNVALLIQQVTGFCTEKFSPQTGNDEWESSKIIRTLASFNLSKQPSRQNGQLQQGDVLMVEPNGTTTLRFPLSAEVLKQVGESLRRGHRIVVSIRATPATVEVDGRTYPVWSGAISIDVK